MTIYSYIDSLLDMWCSWNDIFLTQQLHSKISNLNEMLNSSGSDKPSRAKEMYRIGLLKKELSKGDDAWDTLRKGENLQTRLGFISAVMRQAMIIDPENSSLRKGFSSLCAIYSVIQSERINNTELSIATIAIDLLNRFPNNSEYSDLTWLRYILSAFYCELEESAEDLEKMFLSSTVIPLRILEKDKGVLKCRATFTNSEDVDTAIRSNISLTNIIKQKSALFAIGEVSVNSCRGFLGQAYLSCKALLCAMHDLEMSAPGLLQPIHIESNASQKPYVFDFLNNFAAQNQSFNQEYNKIMKNIAQGAREALEVLFPKNTNGNNVSGEALQVIYYGAPGTGKSHTINRETKGHKTFRTTFHPDSDYSTFVGAYKPVMEEVETRVVPVVLNNGTIFDQNNGTLKEKKIGYKFVKQAFMKAYIAAWRTFTNNSNVTITSQAPSLISLSYNNQTWILTAVSDDSVLYTKEDIMSVDEYKNNVLTYWPTMPDPDENGKFKLGTFDHYHAAGCAWYRGIHGKNHSADECWEAIKNVLEAGGAIEATPNSQTYSILLRDGKIVAITRDNKAYKSTIKRCFENADADSSVQKRIAKELKEFNANDFDKAWEELKTRVNGMVIPESTNTDEIPPVFLIIEEINRGNCAQIFGDLFQLLDRKEGFSQYPIHADDDIRKCLVGEHSDEDPSFGTNGLMFSDGQKTLINSVLDCEEDIAEKIAHGEVLVLPPNLYIWATMNTSDQSLFPIDSAFKRRWDWKYRPITKGRDNDGSELNWRIKADTKEYDWWSFLVKINEIIGSTTNSEDKKLGFFFCKSTDSVISAETFVGKVIFYLWNDVFKNFGFDDPIFKDEDGSTLEFDKFYTTNIYGDTIVRTDKVERFLENLKVNVAGEVISEDEDEDGNTSSSSTRDYTKYSINGVGKYGKNILAAECVKEYIKLNPEMSVEDVLANWKSLGYIVTHFVESKEEHDARTDNSIRSVEIPCGNTFVYVEKNGYGNNGAVDKLIAAVNQKDWNIKIDKVE